MLDLESNNYYNIINGYKSGFLSSTLPEKYRSNVTYEDIFSLYDFDKWLKFTTLPILLSIETTLKAIISYEFAKAHDAISYKKIENYNTDRSYIRDEVIQTFKAVKTNALNPYLQSDKRYDCIRHYVNKNRKVPIWVMFNVITLGTVSKFYSSLLPETKNAIAKHLSTMYTVNISSQDLSSFIRIVTEVRNMCAHNQRLTSYTPVVTISKKNELIQKLLVEDNETKDLHNLSYLFITLAFLMPSNDFSNYLTMLINKLKEFLSDDVLIWSMQFRSLNFKFSTLIPIDAFVKNRLR